MDRQLSTGIDTVIVHKRKIRFSFISVRKKLITEDSRQVEPVSICSLQRPQTYYARYT